MGLKPDLSIVIATRDRRVLLTRTLDTVATFRPGPRIEVVVADHGSTDGTREVVEHYAARIPVRRVSVPFTHESIAEPKNAGADAATGDVLVFLDCGMLCSTDFPDRHHAAHLAEPGGVVAGAVFAWDSEDDTDEFWSGLDLSRLPADLPPAFADPRAGRWEACSETAWMLVWGANMSMRRIDFLDNGGFDSNLRGWGWDDLELAYRLRCAGHPPRYDATAWAVHYPHPRAPLSARRVTARRNWLTAYRRHRTPEMETWDNCDFWDHTSCQRRMRAVVTEIGDRLPAPPVRDTAGGKRVLYGFAAPHRPHPADIHLALPGTPVDGTGGAPVTYGLWTDLPEHGTHQAVVSPAVLAFDWSPSPGWPSLVVPILREMTRVASSVKITGELDPTDRRRLLELAGQAGVAIQVTNR